MKRSLPGEPVGYSLKLKPVLITLLLLITTCAFTKAGVFTLRVQQNTEAKGRVTDIYGKALVDVNVQNLTAQKSTTTDIDGQYKIDASKGDTLLLALKGFAPQQFIIADKFELNVVMREAHSALDTNYNVLYQSQRKALSVQALSQIGSEELQKTTSSSFNGLLAGRIAGLYTSQLTGEPGNDNVILTLRGVSPLVLIDGVPQNFTYINPEQIESVTVLKDAVATAMLGIRGSAGAIQITTKRGAEGPQRISFTATAGVQQAIKRPRFLNAYDYASLYNEALVNDGKNPVYTQQDLDLYKNGTDPLGHPDIDWQNQVLNKQSPYQRYDVAITGGRKATRYFVNLDYLNQEGPFKTESFNTYNTNSGLQRYTLSSNIDIDFNKHLSTSLHIYGQILNGNDPGATAASIFSNFITTPNAAYPVKNPDGSLAGTEDYQSNIYGQTFLTGYRPYTSSNFNVDLSLKGNLDPLLKGLWIKGLAALSNKLLESINRSKSPLVYQLSGVNTAGQNVYAQYGTISDQVNTTAYSARQRLFYTELSAGYSHKMKNSGIDALVLTSDDSRMIDDQLVSNLISVSGRVSYNFKEKYLAEAAVGYNGSERYPENHRYGFFPAVGLGWVISKEEF
jgi:TonB-linked SusC/RagA family outer membrane protein